MSSDLEDFEEQIQSLLESVETCLSSELPRLKGTERIDKCAYLKNRVTRARQVYRSIMVEIRELPPDKSPEWEEKAKQYDQLILKLIQDIDWAERSTVVGSTGGPKARTVNEMTNQEITQAALQTANKAKESTARSKKLIEETIDIGNAANAELHAQGEKLEKIEENVENVESNLKRADKQLRIIIRRMASDRVFILLIVLLAAGILAVVVLTVLQKKCIATGLFGGSKWVQSNCPK